MKPAFIAAIMLTFVIYLAPGSKAKKDSPKIQAEVQQHAPAPLTTPHQNHESENDNQGGKNDSPHWYKSPEWILIIVTGITAVFICWQSYETRRSVEASRLKDRARISIDIAPLKRQPVLAGELPETYVTYTIRFDCPTGAFDVSASAGAWIGGYKRIKPRPRIPVWLPNTITPNTQPLCGNAAIIPRQLSCQDFEDVRLGKQFVQFFGVINYTDVFGKKRQTKWHRLWKPYMGLHDYGTWEKIGWRKDNCQT